MTDQQIAAAGVISVASNVAPWAIARMVQLLKDGSTDEAENLLSGIKPLFDLVTVKTMEKTPYGEVVCRARNPLAMKALISILGMPSGGCRQPLGKMTKKGLKTVLDAARKVQSSNPEIFKPLADFFGVDVENRLNDPSVLKGLYYEEY